MAREKEIASIVYAVFQSQKDALGQAEGLVSAGLVACANILPPIDSVYVWQGKVERAREWAGIFKTRHDLVAQVIETIQKAHTYECPAILSWNIDKGYKPYLAWLTAAVRPYPKTNPNPRSQTSQHRSSRRRVRRSSS